MRYELRFSAWELICLDFLCRRELKEGNVGIDKDNLSALQARLQFASPLTVLCDSCDAVLGAGAEPGDLCEPCLREADRQCDLLACALLQRQAG